MRGIKLKRSLLCFAMVFCIVFSLCGCEKNNAEEEETTAETRTLSTQATEQTTLQSQSEKKETTTKITTQTAAQTTTSATTARTTTQTKTETTAQTTAPMTKATTQTKAETITTTTVKTTQTTKQTTARTTEETTTETTLQTLYYPEEELDAMAENMPEIVFVMSLYINTRRNIFGYFVTNTGEIKMFDFEPIAPGEFYDIQDVYERLDKAVCDEFPEDIWRELSFDGEPLTNDELIPIPEKELKEKYQALLSIDKNGDIEIYENELSGDGCYSAYGMRYNQDNEEEIVLLYGAGFLYEYERRDEISNELCGWLKWEAFPMFPFFT